MGEFGWQSHAPYDPVAKIVAHLTASCNTGRDKLATIDFSSIRSTPKSRNDSFEALAVQLFRVSFRPPADSTFVSLRGDGGDGGVEAYYRKPDGGVAGVQAKYFFQLGDAELRQIDASLTTALKNHTSLSDYWVYIPFDLPILCAAMTSTASPTRRPSESLRNRWDVPTYPS